MSRVSLAAAEEAVNKVKTARIQCAKVLAEIKRIADEMKPNLEDTQIITTGFSEWTEEGRTP